MTGDTPAAVKAAVRALQRGRPQRDLDLVSTPSLALPEGEGPDPHARALRQIEALLFARDRPLTAAELAESLPKPAPVGKLLMDLADRQKGRGVQLVEVAGGWQLRTAPDLEEVIRPERAETRPLGKAAMETLVIIAHAQPITRSEIAAVRGVAVSSPTLDTLLETGWVAPAGRRRSPGRPVTYKTTPCFLEHFGLAGLNDLPGAAELSRDWLLQPLEEAGVEADTGDATEEDGDDEASGKFIINF